MCNATNCSRYWLAILFLCLVANQLSAANTQNNAENNAKKQAVEQWDLVKVDEEQGITVYYRILPSGNIEFKGVTQIESSLSSIIALFLDFEIMPQWLYRTQKVTLLERLQDNVLYIHTIHTMPFPFRNRDSVNLVKLTQAPSTRIITINLINKPDYGDHDDDYVRVPVAVSQWQLLPLANGQIKITFRGYGEPGGSISSDAYHSSLFQWLVKQFLWKVPYKSLRGLKEYADQDNYKNHRFDFIQELNDS